MDQGVAAWAFHVKHPFLAAWNGDQAALTTWFSSERLANLHPWKDSVLAGPPDSGCRQTDTIDLSYPRRTRHELRVKPTAAPAGPSLVPHASAADVARRGVHTSLVA